MLKKCVCLAEGCRHAVKRGEDPNRVMGMMDVLTEHIATAERLFDAWTNPPSEGSGGER